MRGSIRNNPTAEQISVACRHVDELQALGMSENMAVRSLEFFVDTFAKVRIGGYGKVFKVDMVPAEMWSDAARRLRTELPSAPPGALFTVEHGTPRRHLARLVKAEHQLNQGLTDDLLMDIVSRHWLLAVITKEEDSRLNRVARSRAYPTPKQRWAAAGITFSQWADAT